MVNRFGDQANAAVHSHRQRTTGVIAAPASTASVASALLPRGVGVVDGVTDAVNSRQWAHPGRRVIGIFVKSATVATAPLHLFKCQDRVGRAVQDVGKSAGAVILEDTIAA